MSRRRTLPIPRVFVHVLFGAMVWSAAGAAHGAPTAAETIDFNRDIRPILSENCIRCHGPDAHERKGGERAKGGLRLDTREGALAMMNDFAAIVPGDLEQSELYQRIIATDENDIMPPPDTGKKLTDRQKNLLKVWVEQGGHYAEHWSYVPPVRPASPAVSDAAWPVNPIDAFILARLDREKLSPAPEADRRTLARRVALDLTGLPPTPAEVARFESDLAPGAYARMVDRLLEQPTFGEHWTRLWLDQARYADSAGYADDPARVIWAYRDYVIRSFNANKPFDQFTTEQIAGDLLPNPTEDQLIATAFHRNTPTNSEGGTIDEEFRNVAVVDRVGTTMTAWMGTTMACAQCHTHKYDPFTHDDYFRLFAMFNNTADNDQKDEAPVLALFTPEQKQKRQPFETEIAALTRTLRERTPALLAAQPAWEARLAAPLTWQPLASADPAVPNAIAGLASTSDAERVLTALRVEALPAAAGEFVVTRVSATITPAGRADVAGRYLRIELPGADRTLALAEVQVYSGGDNVAPAGSAKQSSTDSDGGARLAIDGARALWSVTATEKSASPWWELDLRGTRAIERLVLWNRPELALADRLAGARVTLLDADRATVWTGTLAEAPALSAVFLLGEGRPVRFASAHSDTTRPDHAAESVLNVSAGLDKGWSANPSGDRPSALVLLPDEPTTIPAGARLIVTVEQLSRRQTRPPVALHLALSADARASEIVRAPLAVRTALRTPAVARAATEAELVTAHYLTVAPLLGDGRRELADATRRRDAIKPYTTVPVMSELTGTQRRTTYVHRRGNYLDHGDEIAPGVPEALHPLPVGAEANRLGLARWLLDEKNPLTTRVIANLFWESMFGLGIVRTSEDFGSQGELPTHPELLDWLAVEFRESGWDVKHLLRLMANSATYRQASRITPEALARDFDNRLHARGPRFRLSAEMIRDQALAVGGLLSAKQLGPPVNPPQPLSGLGAAFGATLDWENSVGEDRFRRGLYTTWRRSNPYASMTTFDAPSREVCTVRRERSNTPLQALVTLNDPVYIEAAQGLARRIAAVAGTTGEKLRAGFELSLARAPSARESTTLLELWAKSRAQFAADATRAIAVATDPIGPVPPGADVAELAAWTVVGNVLLNLDELLMKP